ncbi:MAG TPA: LLM class flavin-dependent oxidoreductase [Gemmatimonadetes bacterium]|nr:LLM class flavin-dependent oxidoreductase [Gemmatimonadota bacterium]
MIESAGWDYIWLGGSHFSSQASMSPQVLMLCAVMAARTKNLKIGSSIHRPLMKLPGEQLSERALPHERYTFDNLMLDDPFQTAEQVAIIDQVSKGRFYYGAGARSRGSDERRDYFYEFLEVFKQVWTEAHFSGFEGKYYNYPAFYEPYLSIPKPYQKPYPPMLLPVDSQESFVPMGTLGYKIAIGAGSSTHNIRGSAILREDVKAYRQAWKDAGHSGEPTTVVRIPTLLADTKAEADEQSEKLMDLAARAIFQRAIRHRQHGRGLSQS